MSEGQMSEKGRIPEDTLQAIGDIIRDVVAEEWIREVPITHDTAFNADLELESLEFVALAERLQERYGSRVDFVGWLSGQSLEQIIAMKVGDLADFLDRSLDGNR
jgi:acyl carrier protein